MKKLLTAIILTFVIYGCTAPNPVYKAAGQHNGEKYIFEITAAGGAFDSETVLKINGSEAFRHKWKNLYREPTCEKTAAASWKCKFDTLYDDKKLTLIYETRATLLANMTYYEIYLDDEFVEQINVTINT